MTFNEMQSVLQQAEHTIRVVESQTTMMVEIATRGERLRLLPAYVLRDLKRKLKNFNSNTGEWK